MTESPGSVERPGVDSNAHPSPVTASRVLAMERHVRLLSLVDYMLRDLRDLSPGPTPIIFWEGAIFNNRWS